MLRRIAKVPELVFGQVSHNSGGNADNELSCGHDGARADHRARRNEGLLFHDDVVENDGPHPDERPRTHVTSMQNRTMSDGDIVFDDSRARPFIHVNHRQVLDVRARADPDVMHVPSKHRAEPNTRIRTDHHVADDMRAVRDIGRFVYVRRAASIRMDHEASFPTTVSQTKSRAKSYETES